MALEKKMIEPFVETQVRQRDGQPVVSYGLSSFGYDIRVSRHFRIFTNV
jgi:dCTP deaminase